MARLFSNARSATVASAVVLALLVAIAVGSMSAQRRARLETVLTTESGRLETAYRVSSEETRMQMVSVSTVIASDSDIVHLMERAAKTVAEEGGGSGGVRSSRIRAELLERVSHRWKYLKEQRNVELMHFVLPGWTSFLRVNAPSLYGDSLSELRPMLRDVEKTKIPKSGFEAGKTFSWFRGAVPIYAPSSGSGETFVGILETGVSPAAHLAFLSRGNAAGFAMLLSDETVEYARIDRSSAERDVNSSDHERYLLAASGPEMSIWMNDGVLPEYDDHFGTGFFDWGGKTFQLTRMPLEDYRMSVSETSHPAGSIVFWKDVSDHFADLRTEFRQMALRAFGAYLLSLALLIWLVRFSSRELRRRIEERTKEVVRLSEQNRAMLMAVGEGVYGVDFRGMATFVNPSALEMLGFREDEIAGVNQHSLFHYRHEDGTEYPPAECPVSRTLSDGKSRRAEDWFVRKDGTGFPVLLTVEPVVQDGVRTGAIVVFRDITELRKKEESLIRLATTDPLTGTFNRRAFYDRLGTEAERSSRLGHPTSLLMADIDHFKKVNDTYGHAAGDDVLKHFADLARKTFRHIDTVGRIGGEEFAILLPETSLEQAKIAAERFRVAIAERPIDTVSGPVAITVSIGVSVLDAGRGIGESVRRADEALYAAKSWGRNRVELAEKLPRTPRNKRSESVDT